MEMVLPFYIIKYFQYLGIIFPMEKLIELGTYDVDEETLIQLNDYGLLKRIKTSFRCVKVNLTISK
jgi:hypothetical protein